MWVHAVCDTASTSLVLGRAGLESQIHLLIIPAVMEWLAHFVFDICNAELVQIHCLRTLYLVPSFLHGSR